MLSVSAISLPADVMNFEAVPLKLLIHRETSAIRDFAIFPYVAIIDSLKAAVFLDCVHAC